MATYPNKAQNTKSSYKMTEITNIFQKWFYCKGSEEPLHQEMGIYNYFEIKIVSFIIHFR